MTEGLLAATVLALCRPAASQVLIDAGPWHVALISSSVHDSHLSGLQSAAMYPRLLE
jgi:hypothetical protein